MAIAYRATGTAADTSSGSSVVPGKPTGTAEGDILVAVIARQVSGGSASPNSVPSGWTPIDSGIFTSNYRVWIYYKVAGASEPADYTWGWAAAAKTRAVIHAISGAVRVSKIGSYAFGTSNVQTATAISTDAANEFLLHISAGYNTSARTFGPQTSPLAFTERHDAGDTGSDWYTCLNTHLFTSSGTTGDVTGATNSAVTSATILLALSDQALAGSAKAYYNRMNTAAL